jgi:hypothetical protein
MSFIKTELMKYIFYLVIISCLIFAGCKKEAVIPEIQEISSVRGYKDCFIDSFRCGLFVPPSYDKNKKYPLIIYLHGYTDTVTWNLGWYDEPLVTGDPCIVLTPKCPKSEIYGWGDSFDPRTSPMMAKTYEMMAKVEKAFNLDQNRYYIYGASMGGIGTYGAIQKNPDMFAAAYVECANGNVEIAPIIAKMPFWIFHGSEDPIEPVQNARDIYQDVLNCGGKQIRYTEYEGLGHDVWDTAGKETTLPYWLLAQSKGSVHGLPNKVNNFIGYLLDGNKIHLQWDIPIASEQQPDNKIWYCKIYRNGEVIKEIYNNHNNFTDSSLIVNNTYEYSISAVNYYFKESVSSQTLSFTY